VNYNNYNKVKKIQTISVKGLTISLLFTVC